MYFMLVFYSSELRSGQIRSKALGTLRLDAFPLCSSFAIRGSHGSPAISAQAVERVLPPAPVGPAGHTGTSSPSGELANVSFGEQQQLPSGMSHISMPIAGMGRNGHTHDLRQSTPFRAWLCIPIYYGNVCDRSGCTRRSCQ